MTDTAKPSAQNLTGKQKVFLRGLGHQLKPVVMAGKEGVTDALVASLDQAITSSELVKLKVQESCPLGAREVADDLAARTGAHVAQIIGRTVLLFRENRNLKPDKRIRIPRG
ncbi:MAG: ribosome assembly RNA-binding protein YhbY [Nitrospirae bacterium]|nr:ribosome assembly RNA-binding protein YhbY [Nitrospirota bacterium]